MRAPRSLVPTLALLATAAVAAAAPAGGPEFVYDLNKAFEKSKERGSPILIWCVGDEDSAEQGDHQVLLNPGVQKAMAGYLVVFANPKELHGNRDGTIDGKPAKVCRLVPTIACSDHMRAWHQVYKSYADVLADRNSMIKVPNHFVVGPDGKVIASINNGTIASGFDVVPPAEMVKGLKKTLVLAGGPGLTDAQLDAFRKALAAARTSVSSGRMEEAAQRLAPIMAVNKEIQIVKDARELLRRVDKEATGAYGEAKARLGSDPVGGLAALEAVIAKYPGTDSAVQAAQDIETFKSSPEGKQALKDIEREEKGRKELEKAVAMANAGGKDVQALRLLDGIARRYEGLPSGREAAETAESIRNDPVRKAALEAKQNERKARGALLMAKGLRDGGNKDGAIAKLEALIADYPDTDAAKEARKILEELR